MRQGAAALKQPIYTGTSPQLSPHANRHAVPSYRPALNSTGWPCPAPENEDCPGVGGWVEPVNGLWGPCEGHRQQPGAGGVKGRCRRGRRSRRGLCGCIILCHRRRRCLRRRRLRRRSGRCLGGCWPAPAACCCCCCPCCRERHRRLHNHWGLLPLARCCPCLRMPSWRRRCRCRCGRLLSGCRRGSRFKGGPRAGRLSACLRPLARRPVCCGLALLPLLLLLLPLLAGLELALAALLGGSLSGAGGACRLPAHRRHLLLLLLLRRRCRRPLLNGRG